MSGFDLQKLVDTIGNAARNARSDYHLTLGRIIPLLEAAPTDLPVRFDWNEAFPNEAMSYRGYYSDLAFDWSDDPKTVGSFLAVCKAALGQTYTGYKGGDFTMGADTPLWASPYGSGGGRAIMGLQIDGEKATLVTKEIER